MTGYKAIIQDQIHYCLDKTDLKIGKRLQGKVRDTYALKDKMVFVTTDRQSAFDRVLASIPFKGQVLNQTSAWWFERTRHIIPNHVLNLPDPNVTIGKRCRVFPVEFVMRGYITGSTSTSLWTAYKNGSRNYCGNMLPEGLVKNQKLEKNMITPTTKDTRHDRPVTPEEIVAEGLMSPADWDYASRKARELFAFGQAVARKRGLILVDTKYELGKDPAGNIILIDEIHTPDSSRYWIADSYPERFAAELEPENIDKEFLRLWFKAHCDPYDDVELPPAPADLVVELSRRYIQLYEMITGEVFQFPDSDQPIEARIQTNLAGVL